MHSINIFTYPSPVFRLRFDGIGPVFAQKYVGLYIETNDPNVSTYPINEDGEIDFDENLNGAGAYIVDRLVKNTTTYNRFLEAWLKQYASENLNEKDFLLEMKELGLPVYE